MFFNRSVTDVSILPGIMRPYKNQPKIKAVPLHYVNDLSMTIDNKWVTAKPVTRTQEDLVKSRNHQYLQKTTIYQISDHFGVYDVTKYVVLSNGLVTKLTNQR